MKHEYTKSSMAKTHQTNTKFEFIESNALGVNNLDI
jgi:hypothetical protein